MGLPKGYFGLTLTAIKPYIYKQKAVKKQESLANAKVSAR